MKCENAQQNIILAQYGELPDELQFPLEQHLGICEDCRREWNAYLALNEELASTPMLEPSPNFAAYAISKAALVALVKNVAAEVKDSGITANVVLPSTIDTPANRKSMPNADFATWVAPESIAKLLVWLCSNDAADVNGAVIPIYGRA